MKESWPIYKSFSHSKNKLSQSEEVLKRIDPKSLKLINAFCEECEIHSKGVKRADSRRRTLIQLYDFLEKPLDKISYEDYVSISKAISNTNLEVSSKNALKEHTKRFLKYHYEDSEKRFKKLDLLKLNKTEPKLRPQDLLTEKDLDILLRASQNIKIKALISLLYESAGRPEEILKLKWNDIDFQNKTISFFSGKTKERRNVPLSFSLDHLKKLKEESSFNSDNDYIFPGKRGEHLTNSALVMFLKRLNERAGLKKELWPYLFRHSRLSFLITRLSPKIYENTSGHSLEMGMKTYAHLSTDQAKKEFNENVFQIKELSSNERDELNKLKERMKNIEEWFKLLADNNPDLVFKVPKGAYSEYKHKINKN